MPRVWRERPSIGETLGCPPLLPWVPSASLVLLLHTVRAGVSAEARLARSHLTPEEPVEQAFLWWFRRLTSVQVWGEGTVGPKHIQLLKAFCFYHLERPAETWPVTWGSSSRPPALHLLDPDEAPL